MTVFLLSDAVPPLSIQPDGAGWTVWDARCLPVLRAADGSRAVPSRADVIRLLGLPVDPAEYETMP